MLCCKIFHSLISHVYVISCMIFLDSCAIYCSVCNNSPIFLFNQRLLNKMYPQSCKFNNLCMYSIYVVHPKSNWKKWIKRERLHLKGNYFFEYLKASIADLFTMLSSSVQNSEGGGNGESGDSFADPCQEFKQGFLGVSSGLPLV